MTDLTDESIYASVEDIIQYEMNAYGYVPSITEALRLFEKEHGRFTSYETETCVRECIESYFDHHDDLEIIEE